MRTVLAVPVGGLLVGAAVGARWPGVPPPVLVAMLVGWTLLAVHAGRVRQPGLIAVAACGAFAVGGALLAADRWHDVWRPSLRVLWDAAADDARADAALHGRRPPVDEGAVLAVVGRLRTDASVSPNGTVSIALDVLWAGRAEGPPERAASTPVDGGVLLTVLGTQGPARADQWRAGRTIRTTADLRRVARYMDPAVPDFERIQARRGVTLVGSVKSAALVDVVAPGSWLDERAADIRAFTRRAVADVVVPWSPRAAAIVLAIVIGDRSNLEQAVETRLQEAGTYHVLAISGGNIAILAALTLWGFRMAGVLGRTAMLVAAAGLLAYGKVAMGGASVDRAVLMAVVYFVGRAWDLRAAPTHALVLAAGVLVLRDPLSVADASALLTFGATAGIMAAGALVDLSRLPRVAAAACSMFVASAAAEAALLPVAATLFARVTFAGLVLNFGAIPLMAVAQVAGMVLVPLWGFWPDAARAVGWFAFVGAEGLVRTADLVDLAPWLTWRVSAPPLWLTGVYYAGLVAAWTLWTQRSSPSGPSSSARARPPVWRAAAACACLAAVGVLVPGLFDGRLRGDGHLHVTFIDVGQGDAALVRFPHGSTMLVDAGGLPGSGSFDIGERVVAPVLRSSGVHRLDALVLSHGDADHIGGASAVVREFRPWDIWDGVPVPTHLPSRRLHDAAQASAIRWTTLQRDDEIEIDGVQVRVPGPPRPDWERQDVRNDDSVVLDLRYGDVSVVFTGDIGSGAEADIAPRIGRAPLRILKVPHHGSQTSSSAAFVRALRPDVAVISAGRANGFGHPSASVLARYEAAGTTVLRTDLDGAVSVDTDGSSVRVHTHTGREFRLRTSPSVPAQHPMRGASETTRR